MELQTINESNTKKLNSNESKLYINNDVIYKVFNKDIDVSKRVDIIDIFLRYNITGTPIIYDFIYDNNEIVGYAMKYYEKAKPLSQSMRFKFIKEKCLELIDIYWNIKDNYNICYYDFHNGNININNHNILLLDIDSCIERTPETEENSIKLLIEYIIEMIYKVFFFKFEPYYSKEERQIIRRFLYTNLNDKEIKSIEDLKFFVSGVSKKDTQKLLRKIPYKIK